MAPTLYTARCLMPITAPPVEDGAILVANGRIHQAGRRRDLLPGVAGARVVDFGDSVMLPPLVNAHTHLELTDFPAWTDTANDTKKPPSFVAWILWLLRVRRTVSPEQIKTSLRNGLLASIRAGTGAVGDILTSLDAADVYRGSPLYGRVYAEALGQDPAAMEKRLAALKDLMREPAGSLFGWGLSPHAPYTLSATALDRVFAFAAERTLQCAVHLAESREESAFIQDGAGAIAAELYAAAQWDPAADAVSGPSSVQALCQEGRLKAGDLVVHGVQVDTADIDSLKSRGCHVVLCPRSNAALGVGKAPLSGYLTAGVPLALGTDSLASAPSLSIWEEVAFGRSWFAGQASPSAWLEMATRNGAHALGCGDQTGSLAPSCRAAFQVVKLPAPTDLGELAEALCSAGNQINVTHLYLSDKNVLPES